MGQLQKMSNLCNGNLEGKEREKQKKYSENNNDWEFPQTNSKLDTEPQIQKANTGAEKIFRNCT